MALTKSPTAVTLLASSSNTSGSITPTATATIGYGYSIICSITNGASGPTTQCTATLQLSADNSAWFSTDDVRGAGIVALAFAPFTFNLGVCGLYGDWNYARVSFSGNTGQSVTVVAVGSTTTAL